VNTGPPVQGDIPVRPISAKLIDDIGVETMI
jgi:hypothetical protein